MYRIMELLNTLNMIELKEETDKSIVIFEEFNTLFAVVIDRIEKLN